MVEQQQQQQQQLSCSIDPLMSALLDLSKIQKVMNLVPPPSSLLHLPSCSTSQLQSSFLTKLASCKSIPDLKQLHATLIKTKTTETTTEHHLFFTKLISHCLNKNDAAYATEVLIRFKSDDNVFLLYNAAIRKFAVTKGTCFDAIEVLKAMLENGVAPDCYTLPFVLKACAEMGLEEGLSMGRMVHGMVVKSGLGSNLHVKNTLLRMYAVCGVLGDARKVFDESPARDVVSWTTLIQGFVKMGMAREGVDVFFEMCEAGVRADERTVVVVLSGCGKIGDLELGKKVHRYVCENCVNRDVFVGNALVDMYLKCRDVEFARKVFGEMKERNVVTWNAMIAGLAQQGEFKEALNVFWRMQSSGLKPDDITLVGVLNSCANSGALELGKWVDTYIRRNGIKADSYIGNALVDMYAKCGSIDEAMRVFYGMKCKDVYSYTSLIVGLAVHGEAGKALRVFAEMPKKIIKPDDVTFVGVLTACSHAGLLDEGRKHFEDMSKVYNLRPKTEHYGCMVDILGRAGLIDEAEDFIQKMPIEPDALVLGALLGACSTHGRVEQGKRVLEKLIKIEPEKDGAYVSMSNIYSSANRWKDAVKLRKVMKEQKLKKTPGCSSIELDGKIHEFRKGDKSHSMIKEIRTVLGFILCQLRNMDHASDSNELL